MKIYNKTIFELLTQNLVQSSYSFNNVNSQSNVNNKNKNIGNNVNLNYDINGNFNNQQQNYNQIINVSNQNQNYNTSILNNNNNINNNYQNSLQNSYRNQVITSQIDQSQNLNTNNKYLCLSCGNEKDKQSILIMPKCKCTFCSKCAHKLFKEVTDSKYYLLPFEKSKNLLFFRSISQ